MLNLGEKIKENISTQHLYFETKQRARNSLKKENYYTITYKGGIFAYSKKILRKWFLIKGHISMDI